MSIKEILRKNKALFSVLKSIKSGLKTFFTINLVKTIYINFKTQKFTDAIKFPIYIYGRLKICRISGKITIEAPIERGMIKLGYNSDNFSASKGSALIEISGELIFEGKANFSVDCTIGVIGVCRIGSCVFLGNNAKLRCWNSITLGRGSRLVVDTQIFDSNFHFVRNIATGKILPRSGTIEIGEFCWVGNRTTIMKGTKLPPYSIVAGNSLLNKDYTLDAPVAPTLAGMPAKIITSGNVRVFALNAESEIACYFEQNPESQFYQGEIGIFSEIEELEKQH